MARAKSQWTSHEEMEVFRMRLRQVNWAQRGYLQSSVPMQRTYYACKRKRGQTRSQPPRNIIFPATTHDILLLAATLINNDTSDSGQTGHTPSRVADSAGVVRISDAPVHDARVWRWHDAHLHAKRGHVHARHSHTSPSFTTHASSSLSCFRISSQSYTAKPVALSFSSGGMCRPLHAVFKPQPHCNGRTLDLFLVRDGFHFQRRAQKGRTLP